MKRIIKSLKTILNKEKVEQTDRIRKIRGLPREERESALGVYLHELCLNLAARFVKEELGRAESPFRGLPEYRFFHEVMVVNLWMLDKVVDEKKKQIAHAVREIYLREFYPTPDQRKEKTETISSRYKTYTISWDDYSGHHDIFGEKFTEIMFGVEARVPFRETSFWIISYADETMKSLMNLKKICQGEGIKL